MDNREALLIKSNENIANLIKLLILHEENIAKFYSYNILENVTQCVYQNIMNPINQTCPITHENFHQTDNVILLPNCQHIYKRIPILNWLSQNNKCPLCRTIVL